jgi:phosphate uptake regulator
MMRTHYVQELESVRQNLVEMGETTLSLLAEALSAVANPSPGPSARASELEAQTDHQHRLIHDRCLNLITLQAPVARDARPATVSNLGPDVGSRREGPGELVCRNWQLAHS